jgi:DNA mismatch repair protein MutS2
VLQTRLEGELETARSREKRAMGDEARELMVRLRRARDDLRGAQARLRAKKIEPEALREAERAVDRVAGEVAMGGPLERLAMDGEPQRELVRAPDLRKGARVWVQRLRAEGEVLEILGEGQVRVAAGALKLTVPTSELRAALPAEATSRPQPRPTRVDASHERPLQTRDNTCDLRGLRVDDAVSMATSFLDRALHAGMNAVFLLHGHGTGALRDAVREELGRTGYVSRFRGGDHDQGGDGVTLAWLS